MLQQKLTISTGISDVGIDLQTLLLQITKSQKDTGENHAISALKFEIIKEFLLLGWNVLLSDIDVVVVQVSRFTTQPVAAPLQLGHKGQRLTTMGSLLQ